MPAAISVLDKPKGLADPDVHPATKLRTVLNMRITEMMATRTAAIATSSVDRFLILTLLLRTLNGSISALVYFCVKFPGKRADYITPIYRWMQNAPTHQDGVANLVPLRHSAHLNPGFSHDLP